MTEHSINLETAGCRTARPETRVTGELRCGRGNSRGNPLPDSGTMSQGEFDLIARHFTFPASIGRWPSEGVGDDCALIRLSERTLAVTTDMMAVGTHFLPDVSPRTLSLIHI